VPSTRLRSPTPPPSKASISAGQYSGFGDAYRNFLNRHSLEQVGLEDEFADK